MAVIAAHKDRRFWCDWIDQFFRRQLGGSPFGFIPVASHDPFAFRRLLGAFADAAGEFFWAGGIVQLHRVESEASVDKMHMRTAKRGQESLAFGSAHARVGASPIFDNGSGGGREPA